SQEILRQTRSQKVKKMVATPHFYPDKTSLESFLSKREVAARKILSVYDEDTCPTLYLGAEAAYYPGIGDSTLLDYLTIVGTNTLMIEMPFHKWDESEVADIIRISMNEGLNVILAHIERYLSWQEEGVIDRLRDAGVFIQSNAEFFISPSTRPKALDMLRNNKIHILGSDTHNTSSRPQMIGEAKTIIREQLGEDTLIDMLYTSKKLLEGAVSIDQMWV
ncbi:MAG: CpsB/CapC family capsule biosynthesis tyrosine phosphatase, partial [Candidatus Ornithospirochaeta sp.]